MSPLEIKEEKEEYLRDYKAMKSLFGGLLLESNGSARPEDIAYYQRKFKETQQDIKRAYA